MTKRKSTGKKARFEVFKRDNFTCQYCGGRPPESVLVVDHMTPVKLGGTNELINLITSCEPCNQGKAARPLTQIHPRPDADLMYLEVQQEIAELQRFQRSEQAKKHAIDQTISLIQQSFTDITDFGWQPHEHPIRLMLAKYDPTTVKDAIEVLGRKMNHMTAIGEDPDRMEWVPYMWSVCRNMTENQSDSEMPDESDMAGVFSVLSHGLDRELIPLEFFHFLFDPPTTPLMKAWIACIDLSVYESEWFGIANLAEHFLNAIRHFPPFGKEITHLIFSRKSPSPLLKYWILSYIESRNESFGKAGESA
jgi:hypothetical protein